MLEVWLLLLFLSVLGLYYFLKNRLAVFFPSSEKMIETVLEFADPKKSDIIFDLGSGDGRILKAFGSRGHKIIGVEQNPLLNWLARRRTRNLKSVKITKGDIFDQDLSKATVIIAYLSRKVTYDLEKKIEKEAKKRTRIIILDHMFKNLKPLKEKKIQMIPIRLYVRI